jgi:TRAP-type transport system small permease protein
MQLLRLIEKYFEPAIIVSALSVIIVLLFVDVVARFLFSTSVAWANEVCRFAFVYMIYFGVSYAIREKRHLRVTILTDAVGPALRQALLVTAEIIFLLYSVFVCYLGVVITGNAMERGQILSATLWPTSTLYAAIIFSGALSALRLTHSLYVLVARGEASRLLYSEEGR